MFSDENNHKAFTPYLASISDDICDRRLKGFFLDVIDEVVESITVVVSGISDAFFLCSGCCVIEFEFEFEIESDCLFSDSFVWVCNDSSDSI